MSIKIEDLFHIYSPNGPLEKIALRNINLQIPKGQFLGIAGHTGSGKSTLIQHINRLLKPTKGKVEVDGRVGLVFQYPEHQVFEETVFKDIAFGPKNMGIQEYKFEEIVKESMDLVGLDYLRFKDLDPFQLSGGELRRTAIAGILAIKPDILVLDEPAAGLDPKGKETILNLVQKLHREKQMTIVLVSHTMEELANYAERIIVLEKGEIILNDCPKVIFQQGELLKSIGLGIPMVTELMLRLKEQGFGVRDDIITVEEAILELKKVL